MKKINLIILGILLIGIGTGATLYANKEQAIEYFNSMKQARESDIDNTLSSFKYVTDKVCVFDYETGETDYCYVDVNFTTHDEEFTEKIVLPEFSIKKDDDVRIDVMIRKEINKMFPAEKVEYKVDDRKDLVIRK